MENKRIEDDFDGKQPKSKTTKMEVNLNGTLPQ